LEQGTEAALRGLKKKSPGSPTGILFKNWLKAFTLILAKRDLAQGP